MELQWIIGPVVGAVIGFITNGIAIKMLFRPLRPVSFMGIKLPFTPGMIPKNKELIARKIGLTISKNLVNHEALSDQLLSEDMFRKIEAGFGDYVDRQRHNRQTLRTYLYELLSEEEIKAALRTTKSDLVNAVHHKLADSALGEKIAELAIDHVMKKVNTGLLGVFGADRLVSLLAPVVKEQLAKNIDDMLKQNSHQLVDDIVSVEYDRFLDQQVCDLVRDNETRLPEIKANLFSAYRKIVTDYLPKIIDTVDISAVVENKILEMDLEMMENLILTVADKELKAIVWLGALLGFIMGFANVLVGYL